MALRSTFNGLPYYTSNSKSLIPTAELKEYWIIREMAYGSIRRNKLLKLIYRGFEFPVNSKYCIQTKQDLDLKKLLKLGKVEMYNECTYGRTKKTWIRKKIS